MFAQNLHFMLDAATTIGNIAVGILGTWMTFSGRPDTVRRGIGLLLLACLGVLYSIGTTLSAIALKIGAKF